VSACVSVICVCLGVCVISSACLYARARVCWCMFVCEWNVCVSECKCVKRWLIREKLGAVGQRDIDWYIREYGLASASEDAMEDAT